jgi:hypothetical protein
VIHTRGGLPGPEGHLIGPWNAQVHRPGPAAGFNQWVLADRQGSTLPPRTRGVVILTVAVAWQSAYEIYLATAAQLNAFKVPAPEEEPGPSAS